MNIDKIIEELYAVDPSLKERENLRDLVINLLEARPSVKIDEDFIENLRSKILLPSFRTTEHGFSWWAVRLAPIGALAVIMLILLPPSGQEIPNIPQDSQLKESAPASDDGARTFMMQERGGSGGGYAPDRRPTDFAEIGVFVMDVPTTDQPEMPRLVYEKPGMPALTKKIIFDGLSVCGSVPCLAMSVTLDVPFGGKRVVVEGILEGDDMVLLRRMRRLDEGEREFIPSTGMVYIAWPEAQELIRTCQAVSISQSHSLEISIMLNDGQRIYTVEPVIDEIFEVYNSVRNVCGDIPLATE